MDTAHRQPDGPPAPARRRGLLAGLAATALLTASLTAVIGPAPAGAAAAAAPRLLTNLGFESGLASWSTTGDVTPVTGARTGTGAARMADPTAAGAAYLRSARLQVVRGEELSATAWMSRESGSGGALYLEFFRSDGTRAEAASVDATAAAGWQPLAVQGLVPDDAVTAGVLAYHQQGAVGAVVWDDVALSALPPTASKVPNGAFEEPRNPARPTQWRTDIDAGATVALVRGAAAHGGDTAAHGGDTAVRTTDGSTTGGVSLVSRQVAAAPGETITASVWVEQAAGGTGQQLYLEFRRPPASGVSVGDRLADPPVATAAAGGGWRRLSVTGTAPAGTAGLTVRLYSTRAGTGTTTWDDVTLRSSADVSYEPGLAAGAPVLFVGDQRVESVTGLNRVVHPGVKAGTDGSLFSGAGRPSWDANPRVAGTVLPDPAVGYRMWYSTSDGRLGYAESADGLAWSLKNPADPTRAFAEFAPQGVVENPAWTTGSAGPRYFMLRAGGADSPGTNGNHYYYPVQSTDGKAWVPVPGAGRIAGWDVANVTWDPVTRRFVAMHKSVPVDYRPPAIAPGPRTVWVSTSADFRTWSTPRPSFAADLRDDDLITDPGYNGTVPWAEVYGMAAVRYGDQYLGLPWIFDVAGSPRRDNGDPGPDTGRSHLGLAASRDLVTWSRPDRTNIVTPGARGAWDRGFQMGSTTLLNVRVDGEWRTRFYYGSFAGEHVCDAAAENAGWCSERTGNSRVGLVSWPMDRFVSLRAATGGGSVTTRPLTPVGRNLTVNADLGTAGQLRVEVLSPDGTVLPGYAASDAVPVTGDARAPGTAVTWAGGRTTLPDGPVRLRFTLTGGDLYSYRVS